MADVGWLMAEALTSNQKSSFKSLNRKHYEERRRKDTLADSCKYHHGNPHHAGHNLVHGSVKNVPLGEHSETLATNGTQE